jgi:hypothetical protein
MQRNRRPRIADDHFPDNAGPADPGIKGTYQQRRQLSRIETYRQPLSDSGIGERRAITFPRRQFLHLAAKAVALPAMSRIARAQTYPSRTVTMIVPFATGGPTGLAVVFGETSHLVE